MSRTLRYEPLNDVAFAFNQEHDWPWHLVGVFPTERDVLAEPDAAHRGFMYTVGIEPELWCPQASIEDRGLDFNLLAVIVNTLALATRDATLRPGDNVLIPLGIPNAEGEWDHDADAVFWIGAVEPNDGRRQTYQTHSPTVIPMVWSSPLGWRSEP